MMMIFIMHRVVNQEFSNLRRKHTSNISQLLSGNSKKYKIQNMDAPSFVSNRARAIDGMHQAGMNNTSVTKPGSKNPEKFRSYVAEIDCSKPIAVEDINYEMVSRVIDSWDQKIFQIPDWARVCGDRFLRHIFRIAPETVSIFGYPKDTKWDDPALSEDEKFVQKGIRLIKAIDMAVAFLGPDLDPLQEQLYQLGWQHIAMKALPSHWPIVGDALLAVFDECMVGGFTEAERDSWIKVCPFIFLCTLRCIWRTFSQQYTPQIYGFMGYHMIQGLTAHYDKKGELWKVKQDGSVYRDGSDKASLTSQLSRSTFYRQQLHCTKRVSSSDISFSTVDDVINSWKEITAIPNWEKVAGDLFLRYIFKIEPGTIQLFGFPDDTDYTDPELTKNMKFVTKGVVLIKAIDTAVQLLGPDLYPLEEVLYDLGKRHVIMKAQPEFWPVVGEALFLVYEELMGDVFQSEVRNSWTIMYNFLGYHMIEGLKFQYKEIEKMQSRRMTA
jgi:hemoglobin-like flavoprotein